MYFWAYFLAPVRSVSPGYNSCFPLFFAHSVEMLEPETTLHVWTNEISFRLWKTGDQKSTGFGGIKDVTHAVQGDLVFWHDHSYITAIIMRSYMAVLEQYYCVLFLKALSNSLQWVELRCCAGKCGATIIQWLLPGPKNKWLQVIKIESLSRKLKRIQIGTSLDPDGDGKRDEEDHCGN